MSGPRRKWVFAALVVCIAGGLVYFLRPEEGISYPPGILVPEDPHQVTVSNVPAWNREEYTITPLAEFRVRARILHTKSYHHGRESDLSPVDLALGWKEMSDQRVLDRIDISQSGRWYEWRASKLPIARQAIVSSSANMHIIPADADVDNTLESLRTGEIVTLSGYLVDVRAPDGWHWRSSLSRTDEGNGACEVVWLKQLTVE